MKTLIAACSVLIMALMAGCSEEAKTTQWYVEHPDVLAKVYAACKESGDATLNCQSATQAQFQIKQLNAPIPGFDGVTSSDDRGKVSPFKSYAIAELSKDGLSQLNFPMPLIGKSLNELKGVRQTMTESELALAKASCEKIERIGTNIPKDSGSEIKYQLNYGCKLLGFIPREKNFRP
ncbi:hypothetical protein ALP90_200170 [Pseudomonas amygdali pv. ulmi]|uniref:Lipoprotein n=1 Tax=Pseudomonas amygdali pv. ulmi TaxID=251720 RepID=A0A3M4SEC8_PSEA0|nr:EexN family lipoprotein [Pseudomonas amygdali]RMR13172.1 hypothetical protein ALP90_200170 [Pseudomonas amygdali pv. ulmi]